MDVALTMFLVACAMKPATASSTTLRDGELDIGTCEQREGRMRAATTAAGRRELRDAIFVSGCLDACVLTRAPCTSGEVHSPYQNFKPPRRYLFLCCGLLSLCRGFSAEGFLQTNSLSGGRFRHSCHGAHAGLLIGAGQQAAIARSSAARPRLASSTINHESQITCTR